MEEEERRQEEVGKQVHEVESNMNGRGSTGGPEVQNTSAEAEVRKRVYSEMGES